MSRTTILPGIMLALAALGGCAGKAPLLPASATQGPEAYLLGVGDTVRITVFNEASLTGEYKVTDAGNISFPLIGNVPTAGLRLTELQAALAARLDEGYVNNPNVSVEVAQYGPYYILGEVSKPGEYPFRYGLIMEQAVAAAGGFSYRANRGQVFLRRRGDKLEYRVDLDKNPIAVQPGDTIRVGERFF
ncbi:MAG: polysaccharide biosynthesis/export family protein [Rhizorhabdus sp.]